MGPVHCFQQSLMEEILGLLMNIPLQLSVYIFIFLHLDLGQGHSHRGATPPIFNLLAHLLNIDSALQYCVADGRA